MRALITAILVLLWLLLGWYYKTTADECCKNSTSSAISNSDANNAASIESTDTKVIAPAAKTLGPLTFNWGNSTTNTNEGWEDYKNNLLMSLREDDKLLITGKYRANEENTTTYENLGLARANEARKLFKDLPDSRFELKGELVNDDVAKGSADFESTSFRTLKVAKNIKETANGTLIYFPYNSNKKLDNREVEAYLNDVAERVIASGERIRLTGHTDSTSSSDYNMRLGQRRANIIRDYLVSKGVDREKIIANSKGETSPIADNSTRAGKAKNRRTELQIIK